MRRRKQHGSIVRIGDRWYVRYWERRTVAGKIERKRVTHHLGPVISRGKHPPMEIVAEAERHMAVVNGAAIPADRIVTIGEFVERVYLPWTDQHKRPSTTKGYRDIWEDHLKPLCEQVWLRDTRTYHVQRWLDQIGAGILSRNTLKHIKSVVSGIFKFAKQQDYFQGENPARDTAINPAAAEPQETHAYTLDEIRVILHALPEPASTVFAVAAFTGLRHGEIQGLLWENYRDGEMYVSRSIWNGHVTAPKTRKGRAAVPVIPELAERLEMHRLCSGSPQAGPIFASTTGHPLSLGSVVNRVILPTLNRCETCRRPKSDHQNADHEYKRDSSLPEWHGWHAARRGLGSNLYRLGVSDMVIQRILRHANVSTTTSYYIKTVAGDVRSAMTMFQDEISKASPSQSDTLGPLAGRPRSESTTIQ